MASESSSQVSQEAVESALNLLWHLEPAPLAINWEFQDLFVVNVFDQPELSVRATYFKQVIPSLNSLIAETDDPARWMVVFQDPAGHLIASCMARDEYAI